MGLKVKEKQWDVKTITIPSVQQSFWGIRPGLIPQFVQLYGKEAIDDMKEGQEYLNLSFNKLKKLVAFLHGKGYNTDHLSNAVQQAINDALAQKNKEEAEERQAEEKKSKEFSEQRLFTDMQYVVRSFGDFNQRLRIHTDGVWGPTSQNALNLLLQTYRLPSQTPSEALLKQLQALFSRIVCLGCADADLMAVVTNNPFCITANEGNGYRIERKGDGVVLQRMQDSETVIGFPTFDRSYFKSGHYTLFSAWLMLLSLTTEKPYDDFCDLWVKREEDAQSIERPSAQEQKEFVAYPDVLLPYGSRDGVALLVKYIPRTNFDIDVIAVYFSPGLQFRISRGEEIREASEVGRQLFFACDKFFEEPADEQKALAAPLVKADFVKLFVVRKNRVLPPHGESPDDRDNLSDDFYRLITAPPEALLATVTIGLRFEKKQTAFEDFKKSVEKDYAERTITEYDDLQKGRWGGQSRRNGLQLTATVIKASLLGFYSIEAKVGATENSNGPLSGHVAFLLHDSFPHEIKYAQAEDGVATLKIARCYEAFTLAAYTEDGTTLELDLNDVPGYPKGFYWKDLSAFQDRVKELYEHKPVRVKDDLQKGRWGGSRRANGKTLSAAVEASWIPGFYNVHLTLTFDEPKPFKGEAAFFLHDSFGRQIRFAPIKDGQAELKIKAYETFTAGAYTEDGTELELDLNEVQGFPEGFYYKNAPEKP